MTENTLIDNCFYIKEDDYELWTSYDNLGEELVTSLGREECIKVTRFLLKRRQENRVDEEVAKTYSGVVSGKL
jgi:hypothetical protein